MNAKSDTPGEGLEARLFRVMRPHIGSEAMTRQAIAEIIAVLPSVASDTAALALIEELMGVLEDAIGHIPMHRDEMTWLARARTVLASAKRFKGE